MHKVITYATGVPFRVIFSTFSTTFFAVFLFLVSSSPALAQSCNPATVNQTYFYRAKVRPFTVLEAPFDNYEIHEEEEGVCTCPAQGCRWVASGNARYKIFDRSNNCSVVAQGARVPSTTTAPPYCKVSVGMPSVVYDFMAGTFPWITSHQCGKFAPFNLLTWANGGPLISGAFPVTPRC